MFEAWEYPVGFRFHLCGSQQVIEGQSLETAVHGVYLLHTVWLRTQEVDSTRVHFKEIYHLFRTTEEQLFHLQRLLPPVGDHLGAY
jgi:hypothetical protein